MTQDSLHLDADRLRALASDAVVRRGFAYFKENRVVDLGSGDKRIWAQVEGSRRDFPYQVEVTADEDGEIQVTCDCPFDTEPACKHAVAALIAYAARQPVADATVSGAGDAAAEERAKRGRAEVRVEHVRGNPWFGVWKARSIGDTRGPGQERTVELRSITERINSCTCPDFAHNRLGTCKHIEAVVHRLKKAHPAIFRKYASGGPPHPVISLAWGTAGPSIRLRRTPDDASVLSEFFDRDGQLSAGSGAASDPAPRSIDPDRLHAMLRGAEAIDGLWIGSDVTEYARRLAEEASHGARAARIRDEITRTGGHLPGVSARLYPYQIEGVAFLASNGRALLADDMGLGKTLQTIAAASWLVNRGDVTRVLVVCPASLKHQWKREIAKFTGLGAVVVDGGAAARLAAYRQRATFTILNYEIVVRDRSILGVELAPDLLVLDEAQRIKNWRTHTAEAVKSLSTRYAFVLTGTPLENRLEDLYSLMQVVDPRVLGPLWRYLLEFHVTDERGKVLGFRNLSELRHRLAPVMLRRDRSRVRDQLPDRVETRRDVPMDPRQRELHDGAMQTAATIAQIAQRRPLTTSEEHRLMAALQSARMACDAAGLVDHETVGSPKLDELSRLLEEICVDGGQKVVVFSQWERMTAMAEEVAHKLGLGTARLHGGVPSAARGGLIDRFVDDPACQVFLSTDAGGVGLNLQNATALVNLDLPWNPAVLDQRIARIHRLGQRQTVHVTLLVAENSYEVQVASLIAGKRDLFRHTVSEEASADSVGVSKRSVEAALASLATASSNEPPTEARTETLTEVAPLAADAAPPPFDADAGPPIVVAETSSPADDSLAGLLATLHALFGDRIERVVASGAGLVIILDHVDADTDRAITTVDSAVPVACVAASTWAALTRMNAMPGTAVWERPPTAPTRPRLTEARRRMDAADALVRAGCFIDACEMAARAMLLALADRSDTLDVPDPSRAMTWIFADLVPRGLVTADDATCVARALALAGAASLEEPAARAVLADAVRIVAR